MDDRAWYIKERIQEAYQYAENQRLVKESAGNATSANRQSTAASEHYPSPPDSIAG